MERLNVELGQRSYPIYIGSGVLQELPAILSSLAVRGRVAVVTDANVLPLYGERVLSLVRSASTGGDPVIFTMSPGEGNKRLATIEALCEDFIEAGLDRLSLIVALGGGIVGDVAGFAAACFMRGIRFIQIPTTIVAQVDSSVGGKTGVNLVQAKNIVGAFHQPSSVIADQSVLATLPDRELRAGLAEVIKHGVIADAALFEFMESHVAAVLAKDLDALMTPVLESCRIKADVVARDEREQSLRAILNYGHTFGHAFEAISHYTRFLHGEAVALGMHAAGLLARDLGMVDTEFVDRQRACLAAYGLPVSWRDMPLQETFHAMLHDKKALAGTLKFILPEGIGRVVQRTDVRADQVQAVLKAVAGA